MQLCRGLLDKLGTITLEDFSRLIVRPDERGEGELTAAETSMDRARISQCKDA